MNIKTTINVKKSSWTKISAVASQFAVSKSFIINSLVRKALKSTINRNRFLYRVGYQERISDDSDCWHCMAVSFMPDVYEKCLDVRKLSKISVSRFISDALFSFLDELIEELEFGIKSDNYSHNYLLIADQSGSNKKIVLLWDMEEWKTLIKLKEILTE